MSAPDHLVHCFGCDDVVAASDTDDGGLWCPTCCAPVLASNDEQGSTRLVMRDGNIVTDDAHSNGERPLPRRSRGGGLLGNALIGLHNALYGPREESPALIVEDDQNHDPGPVELHLDEESPKRSWARLRCPPTER